MNHTDDFFAERELSRLYDSDDEVRVGAYYASINGAMPNKKLFYRINVQQLAQKLPVHFEVRYKPEYEEQEFVQEENEYRYRLKIWFLTRDIWIRLKVEYDTSYTTLYYAVTSDQRILQEAENVLKTLAEYKEEKDHKGRFSFITLLHGHFHLKEFKHIGEKVEITDHYNPDFYSFQDKIIEKLDKEKSHGLVLLHGRPGTGKTTFIRHLANQLSKRMIYFPPYMANHIASPELINFLMDHEESILVLEDADDVISKRKSGHDSAISNLLNLSDGILGQCLHIPVICTFNIVHTELDDALLRKGRLLGMYEFKPLQPDTANRLAHKLGFDAAFTQPVTLADVYNIGEENYTQTKQEIGFRKL